MDPEGKIFASSQIEFHMFKEQKYVKDDYISTYAGIFMHVSAYRSYTLMHTNMSTKDILKSAKACGKVPFSIYAACVYAHSKLGAVKSLRRVLFPLKRSMQVNHCHGRAYLKYTRLRRTCPSIQKSQRNLALSSKTNEVSIILFIYRHTEVAVSWTAVCVFLVRVLTDKCTGVVQKMHQLVKSHGTNEQARGDKYELQFSMDYVDDNA